MCPGTAAILNSFVNDIFERIGTSSYFFVAGLTFVAVLMQVHPDTGDLQCGHGHPELVCQNDISVRTCAP
ncbi:hypothetical protein P692DRAFT_20842071 [Suillus brevipes Sb2]|nr:hypothetical protein P692DRAFT_20842071 [Suillus brevipes Sb2]